MEGEAFWVVTCRYCTRVTSFLIGRAFWETKTEISKVKHFYKELLATFVSYIIHHFTIVCSVTRPLNGGEAGGDLMYSLAIC